MIAAPCSCCSQWRGLIAVPVSPTLISCSTFTWPVSVSTSTSAAVADGKPIFRALLRLAGFRVHVRRRRLANRFRRERRAETAELGEKNLSDGHAAFFHAAHVNTAFPRDQIVRIDLQVSTRPLRITALLTLPAAMRTALPM